MDYLNVFIYIFIALRGYKKTAAPDSIRDLDFNLRPVSYFKMFNAKKISL